MDSAEAQFNAIKLSSAQHGGEAGSHMDEEGRVHKCPNCGHEMPMDEVEAKADAYKLAEGQKGGAHMDKEGNLG